MKSEHGIVIIVTECHWNDISVCFHFDVLHPSEHVFSGATVNPPAKRHMNDVSLSGPMTYADWERIKNMLL